MVSSKVVFSVIGGVDSVVFGEVEANWMSVAVGSMLEPMAMTVLAGTAIAGRVLFSDRQHGAVTNAALPLL
jgi:hypothetical protein